MNFTLNELPQFKLAQMNYAKLRGERSLAYHWRLLLGYLPYGRGREATEPSSLPGRVVSALRESYFPKSE
mgnify:CR=1 FL=1